MYKGIFKGTYRPENIILIK